MRRQTGFRSLFSSESRLSERRNTSHGVGIERTRHSPAGWQTAPGESLVQQKPLSFPGMSIIRLRRPEKPLTFERAAASGWCSECHRWKWPLAASQCTTTAPAGDSRTAVRTRSAGAAGSADNRSGGPLVAGNSDVSDVVVCNRPAFHGKNTAETKRGWLTFGQTGSRNSSHFVSEESEHGQKINQ
jgi:hypothetical protein